MPRRGRRSGSVKRRVWACCHTAEIPTVCGRLEVEQFICKTMKKAMMTERGKCEIHMTDVQCER